MGEDNVDGFDDTDGFDPDEVVSFEDAEGNKYECVVLAVVEHEGNDYAMLAPASQLQEGNSEELELFLFRYEVDEDDTELFSFIDDERTYEAVRELCEGLMG
ncbi:MAG: hypothetical protein ACI8PZ_003244 [Myxococcota bacterium]|jgi:uncharacterized protein YrzB (UPF0473 family)